MLMFSEISVPEIEMFGPTSGRHPFSFLRPAQEQFWIAKYRYGYLLSDLDAMKYLPVLEDALPTVARRLGGLKLNGEFAYSSPLGSGGLVQLPIAFEAGVPAEMAEA